MSVIFKIKGIKLGDRAYKTAASVPEFAMEDLPSAELQANFLRLQ